MTFIGLILILVIIGVVLAFIPMDAGIKRLIVSLISAIVAILLIVWIVGLFAHSGPPDTVTLPTVRP
jgi:hypothetical protein